MCKGFALKVTAAALAALAAAAAVTDRAGNQLLGAEGGEDELALQTECRVTLWPSPSFGLL